MRPKKHLSPFSLKTLLCALSMVFVISLCFSPAFDINKLAVALSGGNASIGTDNISINIDNSNSNNSTNSNTNRNNNDSSITNTTSDKDLQRESEEKNTDSRLKTVDEVADQASSSGVVELVEKTKKTQEQADKDAQAQKEAQSNTFNLLGTSNSSLPSKVDLRDHNIVSYVKDQSPWGSCWAFGTNAAAEISIASSAKTNSALNFSTLHTAWFGYTQLSTDKSKLKGTEASQAGEGSYTTTGNPLDAGGTSTQVASEFMQGVGVASLSDIPYQDSSGTRNEDGDWSVDNSKRNYSLARLSKQNELGSTVTSSYGLDQSVLNAIKSEVNAGRGVSLSYRADQSTAGGLIDRTYMNTTNWCQYNYSTNPNQTSSNHLVCIVGYDDNYSSTNFNSGHQPPGNGAFIVKNSWGSINSSGDDYYNWGLNGSGYFYLSYYDHSIDSAVSFEFDTSTYTGSYIDTSKEIIDQYDYVQANYVSNNAKYNGNNVGWYANVYTTSYKQSLHNIGTYYCTPNQPLNYKVYLLKDDATSPNDYESSTPVAQGSYTNPYEGYVSIKLDKSIPLKKGQKYSIWFSQADKDGFYSFPTAVQVNNEYSSQIGFGAKSIINANESFYSFSPESSWTSYTTNSSGYCAYDNYCVKGYATVLPNTSTVTFDTQGGSSVSSQIVKDGNKASAPISPTKKGYTFAGWYSDKECTKRYNFSSTVTVDMTLYAKWTPSTYAIHYELNGGTNASINPSTYTYAVGVSSFANPTKTGYIFAGWYSDETLQTKISSISKTQLGEITIYAAWVPNVYKITYELNGGTNANTNPSNYTYGTGVKSFASPTKQGCTFAGWYSDETYKTPVSLIEEQDIGDKVLFAKWKSWTRLKGNTAIGTMKQIVNEGWKSSEYAIVATNKGYQDALSATGLAGVLNQCPLLMTTPNSLSDVTKQLLISKKVKHVIVVGGKAAISENVESQINALSAVETVERLEGGTAVGTARQVYDYGTKHGGWGSDAIVATINGYQDALSIAPYAYAKKAPIFLTDSGKGTLGTKSAGDIKAGGFTRTLIVGGEAAVKKSVENQVTNARRLSGGTAYGTCKNVANFCLTEGGMSASHVGVATGKTYQDALCGAALCGLNNSILVLADDGNSTNINKIIATNKASLSECYVFGGDTAVSETIYNALLAVSK